MIDAKVEISRLDSGVLIADGLALAEAFFTRDPSSVGEGSYDSLAGRTSAGTIETADIEALNRTMRARTPHSRWGEVTGMPLPWLGSIPEELDLIATEDSEWEDAGGADHVRAALLALVGSGRGVSVATKMLHLKRPRLFPVVDELVAVVLGRRISPDASYEVRASQAVDLVLHVRGQGRANLDALRPIQSELAEQGIQRSLVRILDAILWLSHPGAGFPGFARRFDCGVPDG